MQNKRYRQLADQERESISRGLAQHKSIRQLAKELNRSPSTISREIRRNKGKSGYRAFSASRRAKAAASSRKRGKRKIEKQEGLLSYVMEKLQREWSPQEISRRLKMEYAWDMNMQVSHEAIYQYIYVLPRGELKQLLIKGLRQERKHRRPQKRGDTTETRGKIANMLSIEERPAEVAERSVPGHWEGDLILGKYKRSALGTLVERTTRYTILVPLGEHKDATSVREAYAEAFKTLPAELKKSLTYDQGKEMSEHEQFTIDTGIQVYFAHPGSPWERGTNENTNGLIRQYFPKGTDFTQVSKEEILEVQRKLNDRPRRALGYLKPDEVINQLVALKT
ncbi:MAG TPA: IS30 family transposase [Anaerolineaceae bacterium]|nr:IS30 family transposase [Anaerolineaceae bacterium]